MAFLRGWRYNAKSEQTSHNHVREGRWTESIAVGHEGFVETTREKPGIKAKGHQIFEDYMVNMTEKEPTSLLGGEEGVE